MNDRACQRCGEPIIGKRPGAKWCSDDCRRRAWDGGTCEVCGADTRGGGSGRHPRHCVDHNPLYDAMYAEGKARAMRFLALRREGLLNYQIAAECGVTPITVARSLGVYGQRLYDIAPSVPPYWQRAEGRKAA